MSHGEDSHFWNAINNMHRSPLNKFTKEDDPISISHGVKEGGTSSPVLFMVVYSAIMRQVQAIRTNPEYAPGLVLKSDPTQVIPDRADRINSLQFMPTEKTQTKKIQDLIFADDTTLIEELDPRHTRILATQAYHEAIDPPALTENFDKRKSFDITCIEERNLGVNMSNEVDTTVKSFKGWKSFHGAKSKVAGMKGLTPHLRGTLHLVMVRSSILFGLESRAVSPQCIAKLVKFDNQILRIIHDSPLWKMAGKHFKISGQIYLLPPLKL